WRAMRRPSASQTLTLMLTARLCALARAAWMARFASASLIDMSFAWMDRFEYCVLAFLALLPVFHNNTCRRRPLRCGISTGPMSAKGQKRTSRRQVDHVRFTPESRQRADMPACPRRDGAMVENVTRLLSPRLLIPELGQQTRRELEVTWLGPMKRSLSREPASPPPKIFARVGNPTQGQRVQSSGEEGAIWLERAAMARAIGFSVLTLEVEL